MKRSVQVPDASALQTLQAIIQVGFDHEYHEVYPIPAKDTFLRRRVQVRSEHAVDHGAPPEEIKRYAEAYGRGDKFPPVVYTADNYGLDGTTRLLGALERGARSFHAFVIKADWEGADDTVRTKILRLGVILNQKHGRRLSDEEITRNIVELSRNGLTLSQIAVDCGVKESLARDIVSENMARERCAEMNVSTEGMTTTPLVRIGRHSKKLCDEVFKPLVNLVRDAGLRRGDTEDVIRGLAALDEDGNEQLKFLETERQARAAQIAAYAISQQPTAALPGQVRRALGVILKHNPIDMVERGTAKRESYLNLLREADEQILLIMRQQEAFNAGEDD